MNTKNYISKELFTLKAKEIISEQGIEGLTMRTLANKSNVALGTLYNYFPSKIDLIKYVVSDFWRRDFYDSVIDTPQNIGFLPFCQHVYETVYEKHQLFLKLFNSYIPTINQNITPSDSAYAKKYMKMFYDHCALILRNDPQYSQMTFTETFTEEIFVTFVIDNIFATIAKRKYDYEPISYIIAKLMQAD